MTYAILALWYVTFVFIRIVFCKVWFYDNRVKIISLYAQSYLHVCICVIETVRVRERDRRREEDIERIFIYV